MTNPTQPPPAHLASGAEPTPADVLRGAATYLQRYGWTQGRYYATDHPAYRDGTAAFPPACVIGAIGVAAYGSLHACPFDRNLPAHADFTRAVDVFDDYLRLAGIIGGDIDSPDPEDVIGWNDRPGRTADQVILALIDAAEDFDRIQQRTATYLAKTAAASADDEIGDPR